MVVADDFQLFSCLRGYGNNATTGLCGHMLQMLFLSYLPNVVLAIDLDWLEIWGTELVREGGQETRLKLSFSNLGLAMAKQEIITS